MRKLLITSFTILILVSLFLAFLSFQNKEWESMTASISLTIAIISGWIAYEAFYMQSINRRPQVVLRLDFRSRYGLVLLVAENLGSQPAFNIRFKWNQDLLNHKGEKVSFNKSNSQIEIPVLNPNESTSTIIGSPSTIFKKSGVNLDFNGFIMFQESLNSNKETSYPFQFSFQHFRNAPMDETEEPKTMYELQKIPQHLDKIKDELSKITKVLNIEKSNKQEQK